MRAGRPADVPFNFLIFIVIKRRIAFFIKKCWTAVLFFAVERVWMMVVGLRVDMADGGISAVIIVCQWRCVVPCQYTGCPISEVA